MPYRGRARGRSKTTEDETQVGPPPPGSRSSVTGDDELQSVRGGTSLPAAPHAFSETPSEGASGIARPTGGAAGGATPAEPKLAFSREAIPEQGTIPKRCVRERASTSSSASTSKSASASKVPYRSQARGRSKPTEDETQIGPPPPGSRSLVTGDDDLDSVCHGIDSLPPAFSDTPSEDASGIARPTGGAVGGVTPAEPNLTLPGSKSSGRRGDFIREVVFGGYSRENKKEFQKYVSIDTRQEGKKYERGGDAWEKTDIVANSFPLEKEIANVEIWQYHVSFEPVQDSTRKRINLVRENIDEFVKESASEKMIFDGAALFLPATVRLRNEGKELSKVVFDNGVPIRLTIKNTACLNTSSPTVKQILNRIFRDAQGATGMVQIGRDYFNHEAPMRIDRYSIDIWPGFSTRIDQYDAGIMVTMDTISKIMKNKNVLELMNEWARGNDEASTRKKAEKEIIGETVLTRYNNKTYRIDGIDFQSSPLAKFTKSDESTISYKDYYKNTYNLVVDDNQPLLIHRLKPKEQRTRDLQGLTGNILLIPQLCNLTGLGTMRQDMPTMRQVANVTRFDPNDRLTHMTTFVRRLQGNPASTSELDKLNLRFGEPPAPITVENARVMPTTVIRQGGRPLRYSRGQADWSRALAESPFNDGVTLKNWQILYPKRDEESVRKFVSDPKSGLKSVGSHVGMIVSSPEFVPMEGVAGRDYIDRIREIGQCQLVVCVLPDDKKDRYDAIKQLTCCQKPIPSQLILSKTCKKENIWRSVATKVLLQINCKLQGAPWDANLPKLNGGLMVVGVDTFVDVKMAAKCSDKVNGALVASYEAQATKWVSRPLLRNDDTIERGLEDSFKEALLFYRRQNSRLPDRVVIYRDGVGDGQLANVQLDEVPAYVRACQSCDPDYVPKLTVCVVTKRVPQRFFLRNGPEFVNPQPGTVVDTTVTKHFSEMIDFFIVSQSTNQGTVSPTHYNLIYDSSGWNLDRHQLLAYKLCHLYYNWAGAIRVPAPCQYAHKLAFLVNQNLHRAPSDELRDRLWYL